jgi:predicted AAA+ superfamily ATPase
VYETKIVYGDDLRKMVKTVKGLKKRDCFGRIEKFLHGTDRTRVCALYGLKRTGKTTLLLQTIAEMSEEEFSKCFYAKMNTENTMAQITRDLEKMFDNGYRYAFIDEITLMKDFIDSAALFSDIYSMMGMKIVLSGKDSLGFWLARDNELYDRVRMIHTTFIPFREYSRLLGIDSIDEYIRYGGLLSQGELDFENEDVIADDASFRDDESTRKYVDTAISRNIQHSLACCRYGHRFGPLRELYEADELTSAINRIVEDMNHRFLVSVLTRDFVSSDLGITAHNLKNERDLQKRTNILEAIDKKTVTEKLMKLLNIRNKAEQTVEITPSQAARIKEYLKGLDLIVECPVRNAEMGLEKEERILFTQPGMRYCQAQALVYSLMQYETFGQLTEDEKTFITDRILEEVRGRMLEDIVLLETMKALGRNYDVFKYQFATGEYDMLIYGRNERGCAAYEIKHSDKCVSEQSRHLRNENMLLLTTPRFGTLEGRYVLYLGENKDTEDGIAYRNAEQFLKALPEISLTSGLEETESEDETEGMQPTM